MHSLPDPARDGAVSSSASLTSSHSPVSATATPLAGVPDSAERIAARLRPHQFFGAYLSWLIVPAFGLALIVASWLVLFHQLRLDERRVLDNAMHDTESFVAAFEQYALGVIKDADRTALLVKDTFEREGRVDLQAMIAKGLIPAEALIMINVGDSAGNVVASTLNYNGPRSMADRDFFQVHAGRDLGRLEIGKPITGRISGKPSIPFSRRLNRKDGSFAGVVVLLVNPEYVTDFYRESELGKNGVLSVIGLDGYYRARRSGKGATSTPGSLVPSLLARMGRAGRGSFEMTSRTDAIVRLRSFRVLEDYPLLVSAGQAKSEVLEEFNARRTTYIEIGAAATVTMVIFFVIVTVLAMRLQHSHRRVSEAREALKAAADSSLDKFFLWRSIRDATGKVVDFMLQEVNARGAKFLGRDRQSAIGYLLSDVPIVKTGGAIDKYVRVADTGEPLEEEFQVQADEVKPRWFRHQVVRVNDGIAITLRDITQRRRQEQEVQLQKNFLQTLVDNIPVGVLVRHMKGADRGRIVLVNETCAHIDGMNRATAIGRTMGDVLPADTARRIADLDRQMLEQPMVQEVFDMSVKTPARGQRTLHVIRAPIFDENNEVESVVSILRDTTDEQKRLAELRLASKVFENTPDAIVLSDADDRIIAVNRAFSKLTQFSADEVVGHILAESAFRPIDPVESAARMERRRRDGYICCEVTRYRKDGKRLTLWVTAACVYDDAGKIVNHVRIFTDISILKESEEKLKQLASFDPLTSLPNRRLFQDRLEHAILRADRMGQRVALLFLDLDGFKEVNDKLGHDVGDELLKEVTERLHDCVRASDSLCRLGGDEFTIIVENATLPADAIRVADRIVGMLAEPFLLAGHAIRTTASIGIAIYPNDGVDSKTLIKNADVAMYRAKTGGRNRAELFSEWIELGDAPDERDGAEEETEVSNADS